MIAASRYHHLFMLLIEVWLSLPLLFICKALSRSISLGGPVALLLRVLLARNPGEEEEQQEQEQEQYLMY